MKKDRVRIIDIDDVDAEIELRGVLYLEFTTAKGEVLHIGFRDDNVEINAPNGILNVKPRAANSIYVRVTR